MTTITKNEGKRRLPFDRVRLEKFVKRMTSDYPQLRSETITDRLIPAIESREEYKASSITDQIIMAMLENIDMGRPEWTFVAAKTYLHRLYKEASRNRVYDAEQKYGDFYGLLTSLTNKGIYSPLILQRYSKEEIADLAEIINPSRDELFTYIGIVTLHDRYLARYKNETYELPQERWLIIAMHLMADEPSDKRIELVKEAYWALSNLYMTVATPTMANAGKTYGQLSSCFIDTVEDSLEGIYDSNTDVAKLSKGGGGIGVYVGKIRARGSDIRTNVGASSGVIPWMKQLNNTAVSVDQGGVRKGAIVAYLDVWHKDIFSFLDARLNNGDERLRTHDLFTGVCLPDLFMEKVEARGDWFLFDPHEVRKVMGYSLEDFYDEKEGDGQFRQRYEECVQENALSKVKVPAIDIMKRIMISQLETGTPYMFYRDEVNRKNPNKHAGMIYSSNLCVEISQNMSPTTVDESYTEDGKIITIKSPGDFVVCNLSSINLPKAVTDDVLERLIAIEVRMLDNVIDQNNIEVLQAQLTNQKYRGVGLGTFGWHHLLALKGIEWESDEAVEYADALYEKIAYLTIKASADLAVEKGAYPAFEGSDWQTGEYFKQRGYGGNWVSLKKQIAETGIRNGYLLAVAPNMSTAIIAGSTASIDPIFNVEYSEEKRDYKIPVTAPDITYETWQIYKKTAYLIDQKTSIAQNAARQRHIDQSQSFNLYVTNDIKARDLLDLHLTAWKNKLKTTYYIRSTSDEVEACEWCQ
ncbi:ribonucleoside-diphosphate reductase subunit alpha [Shouchella rhizosphaerae]|uniref:Ribonucleoside-diphosphate reductase n=1 Tax=Shouchella rhizosphaerae TaxID=866786 RepID=A0ABZ2CWE3_9BACI